MTGSSRWAEARPVRRPPNSRRSASSAPSIRRFSSFISLVWPWRRSPSQSEIIVYVPLPVSTSARPPGSWIEKTRIGMRFSRAKRDRRRIHDLEVARQHLVIGQLLVALGLGILLGIGAVDAVDLGALQHRVAAHLGGAQRRRRVGGEEGIAGAGGEDHDPALLQVAHGPGGGYRARRPWPSGWPTAPGSGRPAARARSASPAR